MTQLSGTPTLQRNNPFSEQTAGEYFVGREDEFKRFRGNLDGLAAGTANHAFVAGLHGTGKTSYLDRLEAIATGEGFVGVLTNVDMQGSSVLNVKSVLRGMATAINDWSTTRGEPLGIHLDWEKGAESKLFAQARSDSVESDLVRTDLSMLWRIAKEAGARGIVVCIDEAQWLKPDALSALKVGFESQKHIAAVVSLRLTTGEGGVIKAGRAVLEDLAAKAGGDIGASRVFTTEVAMGPFADDAEAARCIERRLRDNVFEFDTDLTRSIVQLGARVPRDVILWANRVYDRADKSHPDGNDRKIKVTGLDLLDEVVRDHHIVELEAAVTLVEDVSHSVRGLLKDLLAYNGRATGRQLARRIQADADEQTLAMLTEGVCSQLEGVCERFAPLSIEGEEFVITSHVHIYALRIALEER